MSFMYDIYFIEGGIRCIKINLLLEKTIYVEKKYIC